MSKLRLYVNARAPAAAILIESSRRGLAGDDYSSVDILTGLSLFRNHMILFDAVVRKLQVWRKGFAGLYGVGPR